MDEANRSEMSTPELLGATWRVWCSHAGMFIFLMGIPIAGLLLLALIVNYVVAPHPETASLREVWLGMRALQKLAVFVAVLGSFAVQYRGLAASVFATQEIRSERNVGILGALGAVRRKHLRLFWMVMLVSLCTGHLAVIVGPSLLSAQRQLFQWRYWRTERFLQRLNAGTVSRKVGMAESRCSSRCGWG